MVRHPGGLLRMGIGHGSRLGVRIAARSLIDPSGEPWVAKYARAQATEHEIPGNVVALP